jgi:hypothetical protein
LPAVELETEAEVEEYLAKLRVEFLAATSLVPRLPMNV